MIVSQFGVESWMDRYEEGAMYNITDTCAKPLTLSELFHLAGADAHGFMDRFFEREQTYGAIFGAPALKEKIASLYTSISAEEILTEHGATGGNQHIFFSLIRPGDRVIAFAPSYQQFYSAPEALGADVTVLRLRRENGYLPDVEEIRRAASRGVRMICLNNPNNPTGTLIPKEMMEEIISIARAAGAYLFCDEVYAGVSHCGAACPSVADLYEKGIATGSMSKAFSLAGLRLGWLATHDKAALSQFRKVRDYDLVSCGLFDEEIATLALSVKEKIWERNQKILSANLPILDDWVQREERVSYVKPTAGTMALVHYEGHMPSRLFAHRMYYETGAFCVPGDCFEEPFSLRIGYGHDGETLRKGLLAVSEFLDKVVGGR